MEALLIIATILAILSINSCGVVLKEPEYVVPLIVHQVYDYKTPSFFLYLSIKCALHFIQPQKHYLWINNEGKYRRDHW